MELQPKLRYSGIFSRGTASGTCFRKFYNDLCSYLSSGPIIVMVLEGKNAVSKNRELMGATDPLKAQDGTLRKLYGISIDKNSVHGSDSVENGKIEIDFFFK